MSILVPPLKQSQFEIPDAGLHAGATIVEVKDLGEIETSYGPKHKILLVVEVGQLDKDAKPRRLYQRLNLASGQKASLTRVLRQILGHDPGPMWDLAQLVGTKTDVMVEHTAPNPEGRIYANVVAFSRLRAAAPASTGSPKVDAVMSAVQKRQSEEAAARQELEITDSDIPF